MKKRRWMMGVLGCTIFAAWAAAGTNGWTPHGPCGGTVNSRAIDPATPATLYAGTGRMALSSGAGLPATNSQNVTTCSDSTVEPEFSNPDRVRNENALGDSASSDETGVRITQSSFIPLPDKPLADGELVPILAPGKGWIAYVNDLPYFQILRDDGTPVTISDLDLFDELNDGQSTYVSKRDEVLTGLLRAGCDILYLRITWNQLIDLTGDRQGHPGQLVCLLNQIKEFNIGKEYQHRFKIFFRVMFSNPSNNLTACRSVCDNNSHACGVLDFPERTDCYPASNAGGACAWDDIVLNLTPSDISDSDFEFKYFENDAFDVFRCWTDQIRQFVDTADSAELVIYDVEPGFMGPWGEDNLAMYAKYKGMRGGIPVWDGDYGYFSIIEPWFRYFKENVPRPHFMSGNLNWITQRWSEDDDFELHTTARDMLSIASDGFTLRLESPPDKFWSSNYTPANEVSLKIQREEWTNLLKTPADRYNQPLPLNPYLLEWGPANIEGNFDLHQELTTSGLAYNYCQAHMTAFQDYTYDWGLCRALNSVETDLFKRCRNLPGFRFQALKIEYDLNSGSYRVNLKNSGYGFCADNARLRLVPLDASGNPLPGLGYFSNPSGVSVREIRNGMDTIISIPLDNSVPAHAKWGLEIQVMDGVRDEWVAIDWSNTAETDADGKPVRQIMFNPLE